MIKSSSSRKGLNRQGSKGGVMSADIEFDQKEPSRRNDDANMNDNNLQEMNHENQPPN